LRKKKGEAFRSQAINADALLDAQRNHGKRDLNAVGTCFRKERIPRVGLATHGKGRTQLGESGSARWVWVSAFKKRSVSLERGDRLSEIRGKSRKDFYYNLKSRKYRGRGSSLQKKEEKQGLFNNLKGFSVVLNIASIAGCRFR